ncbi:flagellar hook-length control protein FliK [Nocardioides sp. CN2-186]|uniref:flagellar hook-length control protein FliK n=1 Tax=Nocardioides tweenelious TaxID=3156607 RepID=UPI0032B51D89
MNPTSLLTGLGAAITADPALGGASSGPRGGTPGAADLFLSLVAGLLDPTAEAATPLAGTAGTAEGKPTDPSIGGDDATAPEVDGEADPDGMVDPTTVVAPLPVIVPPAVQAMVVAAALPAPVAPVVTDAAPPETADAAPAAQAVTTPEPSVLPATAAPAAEPKAGPDTDPAPTTLASFTPVTATAPAAGSGLAAPVTTGSSAGHHQVTGQVFPEVVRVAQSPEGTNRVTVKLNPESLGEVRVMLTSRRGALEISLAGGEAARRALTEGAPELRRLLESVGRTESRIVIRDLPTVIAPTPVVRTDVSTDLSSGLAGGQLGGQYGGPAGGPGGDRPADREAPRQQTPGSTNATDGTPSVTNPSRPTDSVTRDHPGLDVTM